jgi:hypothetical protein
MEKIVVICQTGDGYTFSGEVVVPLEYESVEHFYISFETWIKDMLKIAEANADYPRGTYEVGSYKFDVMEFCYAEDKKQHDKSKSTKWAIDMPEIYTLEEWFEKKKVTK